MSAISSLSPTKSWSYPQTTKSVEPQTVAPTTTQMVEEVSSTPASSTTASPQELQQAQRMERVERQELPTFRSASSSMLQHQLNMKLDQGVVEKGKEWLGDKAGWVESGVQTYQDFLAETGREAREVLQTGANVAQTVYEMAKDPSKVSEFREAQVEQHIRDLDNPGDSVTFKLAGSGKVEVQGSGELSMGFTRNDDGTIDMSLSGDVGVAFAPTLGKKGLLSASGEVNGNFAGNVTYTFENADDANRAMRAAEMLHREGVEYVDGVMTFGDGRSIGDLPPSDALRTELEWLGQQPRTVELQSSGVAQLAAEAGIDPKGYNLAGAGISGGLGGGVTGCLSFENGEAVSLEIVQQGQLQGGGAAQLKPGSESLNVGLGLPGGSHEGSASVSLSQTFDLTQQGLGRLQPEISLSVELEDKALLAGDGRAIKDSITVTGVPADAVNAALERAQNGDFRGMAAAAGDQAQVEVRTQNRDIELSGIPKTGIDVFGLGLSVEASRTKETITRDAVTFEGTATEFANQNPVELSDIAPYL